MKENIKKILREFTENHVENNDLGDKVSYMQKKAEKNSKYPLETKKISYMKDRIEKDVKTAYMDITGEEPVNDDIVVKVDDNIKDGKIGSFKHPTNKKDLGVMKIHPKALSDYGYVEDIIKHELIHTACGMEKNCRNHKGTFQKVADRIGLPKKYRH